MNKEEYKQEYLGEFVKPKCAVKSNSGKHCPDKPVHFFKYNGKEVGLCKRCYKAFWNGAYNTGNKKVVVPNRS